MAMATMLCSFSSSHHGFLTKKSSAFPALSSRFLTGVYSFPPLISWLLSYFFASLLWWISVFACTSQPPSFLVFFSSHSSIFDIFSFVYLDFSPVACNSRGSFVRQGKIFSNSEDKISNNSSSQATPSTESSNGSNVSDKKAAGVYAWERERESISRIVLTLRCFWIVLILNIWSFLNHGNTTWLVVSGMW